MWYDLRLNLPQGDKKPNKFVAFHRKRKWFGNIKNFRRKGKWATSLTFPLVSRGVANISYFQSHGLFTPRHPIHITNCSWHISFSLEKLWTSDLILSAQHVTGTCVRMMQHCLDHKCIWSWKKQDHLHLPIIQRVKQASLEVVKAYLNSNWTYA